MDEKMYTCQEVADRYKIKLKTVWAMVREGRLPAVKINGRNYRFRESDLLRYEQENLVGKKS